MRFYSYTAFGNQLLESCSETISDLFADNYSNAYYSKIVIVTPHSTVVGNVWREIYAAWETIQSTNHENNMEAWRTILKHGKPIIPGQRLFSLRNRNSLSFFYLLDKTDFLEALNHLHDIFGLLCSLKHCNNNRNLLHAAGVFRENSAYLLLGHSGAGKSTASEFALVKGYSLIHDDHVVPFKSNQGRYEVTNNTFSIQSTILKALFFIKQDLNDYLVPLSPIEIAKNLLESNYESFANPLLHGRFLKKIFHISTDIAHSIPGYELHFRKSPDFWDIIDAELKN